MHVGRFFYAHFRLFLRSVQFPTLYGELVYVDTADFPCSFF